MNCPICKTEMKKGELSEPGDLSVGWEPKDERVFGIFMKNKNLEAYACPKCGKVELKLKEK